MRLFVCGNQEPRYIIETLEYLNDKHIITKLCGSAVSRCMDTVIPWAEEQRIPTAVYFPEENSVTGMIDQNAEIIRNEHPFAVLIYEEDPRIVNNLIRDAANSDSVQYVIREIT